MKEYLFEVFPVIAYT